MPLAKDHDLAHELFHLLTWSLFHPVAAGPMVAGEQEEKLATTFASSLLMPSVPFQSAINSRARAGKVSFESLFDIAREFDVSIESVLWRMHFVYNRGPSKSDLTKGEIDQAKQLAPLLEGSREPQTPSLAVSLSGTGDQGAAAGRDRNRSICGVPQYQQARGHAVCRPGGVG